MTDKQNEVELLAPCLHCGREMRASNSIGHCLFSNEPGRNGWFLYCMECGLLFGYDTDYAGEYETPKAVRAAWNRRAETENSEIDEKTADWTTEMPTEEGFYAVYFANKDTNKRAVAHVTFDRGEFVITLVYENDKHACWFLKDWSGDSSPTHWFRIPTPPLPGKEGM